MARQSGNKFITGTIDNLCFYKMEGKFYVRIKSSLTGKRVKKDPAFKTTMHFAGLLASAAKIASAVYRNLPTDQKVKGLYKKMTGEAMQLLKQGKKYEVAEALLEAAYRPVTAAPEQPLEVKQERPDFTFAEALLQSIFAVPVIPGIALGVMWSNPSPPKPCPQMI